jgi:organic hydroperoxide reductase OsmC/OhrA
MLDKGVIVSIKPFDSLMETITQKQSKINFYMKGNGNDRTYRKASAKWSGDSRNGHGSISTESKVLYEQPYTYQTRFGEEPGTNPEELIAAAHAACFSMALASTLKKKWVRAKGNRYQCNLHNCISQRWL